MDGGVAIHIGRRDTWGFSLAELILSLGIIALVTVMVAGIFTGMLRSAEKSSDRSAGAVLAESVVLDRVRQVVTNQDPDLDRSAFFGTVGPASLSGTVLLNHTLYTYEVSYRQVRDPLGVAVGSELDENRLVKLDAKVWWWVEDPDRPRAGMGVMNVSWTRILHEGLQI